MKKSLTIISSLFILSTPPHAMELTPEERAIRKEGAKRNLIESYFGKLPEEGVLDILGNCQGNLCNITKTCHYFALLTDQITFSLDQQLDWHKKLLNLSSSARELTSEWHLSPRNETSFFMKHNFSTLDKLYPSDLIFKLCADRFKNLTNLDLTMNQLTMNQPFPIDSIANFKQLKVLTLDTHIMFRGTPTSIERRKGQLSFLRRQLRTLTNLTLLICDKDAINNCTLKKLTGLTYLKLSNNNKILNKTIKLMKNIKYLDISSNTNIRNGTIELMTNLVHLDLGSNTKINNKTLKKLINLTHLDLYNNTVITEATILGLTNLKSLYAYQTPKISEKTRKIFPCIKYFYKKQQCKFSGG